MNEDRAAELTDDRRKPEGTSFSRFEKLTRKLIGVPKEELDRKREEEAAARRGQSIDNR
jgi:hypothetical protein